MAKNTLPLDPATLKTKAIGALGRSRSLLRLKLFFGYPFRSQEQRELGRQKLHDLNALIQKVEDLDQDSETFKTPRAFLDSTLLDDDTRTVKAVLNLPRVKLKDTTSTTKIVIRALSTLEQKMEGPEAPMINVEGAPVIPTSATSSTPNQPKPISPKQQPRKIVFWCGSTQELFDTKLIDDILPNLKKKLPNTSVEIKKLGEVDSDPDAEVLYFYLKISGARVDVNWENAAKEYLPIAKGNCAWIFAADSKDLEREILRAGVPSSQIRDPQGTSIPLRICFLRQLGEDFKYTHTQPEETIEQILAAVRMKGWGDLISQEAISEVRYSPGK